MARRIINPGQAVHPNSSGPHKSAFKAETACEGGTRAEPDRLVGGGQWRESRFDLPAPVFEPFGQDEAFAQMLDLFVDGVARFLRGVLEEDAAVGPGVHRFEPLAVDDLRRTQSVIDEHLAPLGLILLCHLKGDVVDGARAGAPARRLRILVEVDDVAQVAVGLVALPAAVARRFLEPHRFEERRRAVRVDQRERDAEEAADGVFGGDRSLGRVARRGVRPPDEFQREAVGVAEGNDRVTEAVVRVVDVDALAFEAADPVVDGAVGDEKLDRGGLSPADLSGRRVGIGEEGHARARRPAVVAVEQVIDRHVVLIDALLDQPEPERLGVKRQVLRGIASDGGDVVNTGNVGGHTTP